MARLLDAAAAGLGAEARQCVHRMVSHADLYLNMQKGDDMVLENALGTPSYQHTTSLDSATLLRCLRAPLRREVAALIVAPWRRLRLQPRMEATPSIPLTTGPATFCISGALPAAGCGCVGSMRALRMIT